MINSARQEEKHDNRQKIFLSALLTGVLFILFLALCAPIVDSDDNFYILYTLGGGYGQPPSHILHYFYEWNPFLFWPIATFFDLYPGFNWYSFFLLLLQFVGSANLLYLFIKLFRVWMAFSFFLLFFLFFESTYLLSLNHSNTSFLLAISGCSSLLHFYTHEKECSRSGYKKLIFPFVLLLISGLLRVPTLGLYVLLSMGMGIVLLPFRQFQRLLLRFFAMGVILIAFMAAHWYYYDWKIPHYKREEQFRQSLFYLANRPIAPSDTGTGITKVKASLIRSWFLYDTSFVTQKDINTFTKNNVQNRLEDNQENRSVLYWAFINSRVYLFLLCTLTLSFLILQKYKALRDWMFMSLPGILTFFYLAIFMKITDGIFIAVLSSLFLSAVFLISREKIQKKGVNLIILFLLLLNTGWMLVRIKKTNESNLDEIAQTRNLLRELGTHQQFLFINTDKGFKDRGFYIWDTPKQYPINNLINKELLITNSYKSTLQRYGINNLMQELPTKQNVILFDKVEPCLKEYYKINNSLETEERKVEGFSSITAFQFRMSPS